MSRPKPNARAGQSRRPGTRQGTIPASESFEARWFAPTNAQGSPLAPVGSELETRRGWTPPPPSKGLAFMGVSLALIAVAVAGTYFFFATSPEAKHVPVPTSTTTLTGAELPGATNAIGAAPAADTPAAPQPAAQATPASPAAPIKTVTPKDLPTVSTGGASEPPAIAKPQPAKATRVAPVKQPRAYAPPPRPQTTTSSNGGSLPDLDNAANAAGLPQPAAEPAPPTQPTSAPTTEPPAQAAPSSALPYEPPLDLENKR